MSASRRGLSKGVMAAIVLDLAGREWPAPRCRAVLVCSFITDARTLAELPLKRL
jgi:hypothetical protein